MREFERNELGDRPHEQNTSIAKEKTSIAKHEAFVIADSSVGVSSSAADIAVLNWGLIPYKDAQLKQMDLVELVSQELARESIIVCTHPPVVTLGRGTKPGDVFGWNGEAVEVSRGGRATYHGPNQIVVYPILDLNHRGRDLHRLMRAMEEAMIATIDFFGRRVGMAKASGKSAQVDSDGSEVDATGVWLGHRKIASIGIGVRKWISFHGLALNFNFDANAFQGLNPCGFKSATMISFEEAFQGAAAAASADDIELGESATRDFAADTDDDESNFDFGSRTMPTRDEFTDRLVSELRTRV